MKDLRVRLLRAAEQEIAVCGPSGASLRAIARRVGVSHQATAHHFDDRAGLFTALALEGTHLLYDETVAAIASAPVEGGHQVAAAGAAYVSFALRRPTMFDVMYRPELLHADDPALVEASNRNRELMIDAITRAQATGWGAMLPAAEIAMLGWATVHGLAVLQRNGHAATLYPDVDTDDILSRVVHALDAITG